MHVIWYDENTMMGVDMEDPKKKIYRYDLNGQQLELLAGKACHLGISPNRQLIAGEFGFYRAEPDDYTRLYLYTKEEPEPIGIVDQWANEKITWWWVAHVNPSFSADGRRLYFIRAVDGEEKFEAMVLDLAAAGIITDKK
jgi:Tol biopolymer transport system component